MKNERALSTEPNGQSPWFRARMGGLAFAAIAGQVISLWALTRFHEEKVDWELRADQRGELVDQLNRLDADVVEARAAATKAEADQARARADLAEVEAALVSERAKVLEARDAESKASASTSQLIAEAEVLRGELVSMGKEQQATVVENARLEVEKQRLTDETRDLASTEAQLQDRVGTLTTRRDKLFGEINGAQDSLIEQRETLAGLQVDLAAARGQIEEGQEVGASLAAERSELARVTSELSTTQDEVSRLEDRLQALGVQRRDVDAALSEARAELDTIRSDLGTESADLAAARMGLNQLRERRDEAGIALQALESERVRLVGEVAELLESRATLEATRAAVEQLESEWSARNAELATLRETRRELESQVAQLRAQVGDFQSSVFEQMEALAAALADALEAAASERDSSEPVAEETTGDEEGE